MPYRTEHNPPAGGPSAEPSCNTADSADHARRSTLQVLVADDNPVNALLARHLLESFGCRVETAASGEIALAMHGRNGYDLIIMDCQMDGLDGFESTRRLRAAESGNQRTPVVGWTSGAERQRVHCIDSGMDDVLQKPVSKDALARILVRWCGPEGSFSIPGAAAIKPSVDEELRALQELLGDSFEEVANIYTAETPRRLASLEACLANGDAVGAGRLAHALAGSSASIGAGRVSELCRTLERACRNGAPTVCPSLAQRIRRSYSEFHERLAAAVLADRR